MVGVLSGCFRYFPDGKIDWFTDSSWYGPHLRAAKEFRLRPTDSPDKVVYRFLWLRSFHPTIVVRVERSGSRYRLVAKRLSGAGGYDPGRIEQRVRRDMPVEDWRRLEDLLGQADFWNMRTEDEIHQETLEHCKADPDHRCVITIGADGAQWVLEGAEELRYHVADVWSPDSGAFREACLFLLTLSGLDLEPVY